MTTFLLVLQLLVTITMVGAILLQRSEGGGLVSSANSFMSARGSKNFLTRLTAILATTFIILNLLQAILAGAAKPNRSLFDETSAPAAGAVQPVGAPVAPAAGDKVQVNPTSEMTPAAEAQTAASGENQAAAEEEAAESEQSLHEGHSSSGHP